MMMIYGMFVFELRTLPHQQLQQNKSWRHVKNERVNRSASWQYIGAGDDRIVLSGVLYPEITGGEVSLSLLTTQAYTGRPWPLIDGVGQIYGMYVLSGDHSVLRSTGMSVMRVPTASAQRMKLLADGGNNELLIASTFADGE